MSVILFYSPFDQRSRDTESLMIAFCRQGHRVISLSQSTGAQIHDYIRQFGIETYTHVITNRNRWYYFRHAAFLVSFIRKHQVQVVYSHLEPANIAASMAQYFTGAKVYLVRHHIDVAHVQGFDRSWTYRLTYSLAKKILVVSRQAKQFMIGKEKIDPGKIIHINLAYDFALYGKPDPEKVKVIKARYENFVTILSVGRFSSYKRPDLVIQILRLLRDQGIPARAILLGKGEMEDELATMIKTSGLTDHVLQPGYVSNVLDYMAASDFLVHPSVSESSCVTVKEAALVNLPVLVCKGIGDFDDYIVNGQNGFSLDVEKFASQASDTIAKYQNTDMSMITGALHKKVIELFGIENVVDQYRKLNEV